MNYVQQVPNHSNKRMQIHEPITDVIEKVIKGMIITPMVATGTQDNEIIEIDATRSGMFIET